MPAKPGERRRQHEGRELVAIGRITEKPRALLVLADRHQHGADGGIVETPQQQQHREGDGRDEPVISRLRIEIKSEDRRADDAADAVLAAGHIGPAERHGVKHRRQRQRQQREIDPAPPQDEKAERHRDQHNNEDGPDRRTEERSRHQVALKQRRSIGGQPEPGTVTERHQPGVADKNVQRHAGDTEHDDFGGRCHRQAERDQHRRQDEQADGGNDQLNGNALEHGG